MVKISAKYFAFAWINYIPYRRKKTDKEMEVLDVIAKLKVNKGDVNGLIELCKTRKLQRIPQWSGLGTAPKELVYADIALITVGDRKREYLCHAPNGILDALSIFDDGEWEKYSLKNKS